MRFSAFNGRWSGNRKPWVHRTYREASVVAEWRRRPLKAGQGSAALCTHPAVLIRSGVPATPTIHTAGRDSARCPSPISVSPQPGRSSRQSGPNLDHSQATQGTVHSWQNCIPQLRPLRQQATQAIRPSANPFYFPSHPIRRSARCFGGQAFAQRGPLIPYRATPGLAPLPRTS